MMPMMAIMMISDEEDREFIRRLFLKNELAMYTAAYRVVHDYHAACDMVSESCVSMIEKIGYLRGISPQTRPAYIIAIVKNNSRMYVRRCRREREVLEERVYLYEDGVQEEVDSALIAQAEMELIHEVLSKIHKRDSELLKMKYFELLSDAEISRRMGIGTASVRFYLTKARRNFSKELERRED